MHGREDIARSHGKDSVFSINRNNSVIEVSYSSILQELQAYTVQ